METLKQELAAALEKLQPIQTRESSLASQGTSLTRSRDWRTEVDGVKSLSIYGRDKEADEQQLAKGVLHLKAAFPEKATDNICVELMRLALKQGMSVRQFNDAVDNYIAHHHYNSVIIADILGYDIRLRFYTGDEVYKRCGTLGAEGDLRLFPRYGKIDGVFYRVSIAEVEALPEDIKAKVKKKIEEEKRR